MKCALDATNRLKKLTSILKNKYARIAHMRASQYFLPTVKETPADADVISHQLMLRAGMIRKLSAGIYTWLPLGLRVLKKVEKVVREEMNRIGALEILMPAVQPAELWQESGRWETYGHLLLRIKDRHERDFCFGPTHEEIITNFCRNELRSYKQLPITFYQIQTKFRDEIRPRFGLMRSREFIMKDAYSFHMDTESLGKTYRDIHKAYCQIFTRLGLDFRSVLADSGEMGGAVSHEFQVLAGSGEDIIAYSDKSDYAANIEKAESLPPQEKRPAPDNKMALIDTPGLYTIAALVEKLKLDVKKTIKTLIVKGSETDLIALIIRGDHDLNPPKAGKLPSVKSPLEFASEEEIRQKIGAGPGSIGPVRMEIPIIIDRDAAVIGNFSCGANVDNKHYIHVNWERDLPLPEVADLRNAEEGDVSPDGKGHLKLARGIEVGHIFQLGDKYSKSMGANVLAEDGKAVNLQMGCYGLGISRVIAAAIEQHHDKRGITWPKHMAPFQIAIIPISMHKSYRVAEAAEKIYQDLLAQRVEVLFDDRKERPGVLFADMELIGIPTHIIVGERNLDQGVVEVKDRKSGEVKMISLDEVIALADII